MQKTIYILVQCTWGVLQTLAGLCVLLAHARCPRTVHHGAIVTIWPLRFGLSLGMFIFVGGSDGHTGGDDGSRSRSSAITCDDRLLVHEYGHTVQSLVLGPAYLVVIGLPSLLWLNVPAFARMRRSRQLSYYSFFTERSANWLGERVLKQPSVGLAHID